MTSVEQGKWTSKVSGKHTFKAGGFFSQTVSRTWPDELGSIRQQPNCRSADTGSGSALASFLLGVPDSASLQALTIGFKFKDSYGRISGSVERLLQINRKTSNPLEVSTAGAHRHGALGQRSPMRWRARVDTLPTDSEFGV